MITPQQAKELTPDDLEVAKKEEQRIDAALRGFERKKIVILPREMKRNVREHLRQKYVDAGWSVTYRSRASEGPQFEFAVRSAGCSVYASVALLAVSGWLACAPPASPIPEPFDSAPSYEILRPHRMPPSDTAQVSSHAPLVADLCGPCAGWWDWGHRLTICADPSEGLLQDELACMAGPCMGACAGWLADYSACEASGDPACTIANDDACNACITTPNALGGCRDEVIVCGYDATGCMTCGEWLFGGDIEWLCPYDSIDASIGMTDCVCSGACSSVCADEMCGIGYYDNSAVPSAPCAMCIQDTNAGCGTQFETCGNN